MAKREKTVSLAKAKRLRDLLLFDTVELTKLYRRAACPQIGEFDGRFQGLVLAMRWVERLPEPISSLWQEAASGSWMPWRGKTFHALGKGGVRGSNQILMAGRTLRLFPFKVKRSSSWLDGKVCVEFDYTAYANPLPIRLVRDEIRRVRAGLYFGPMLLKRPSRVLVGFFALAAG